MEVLAVALAVLAAFAMVALVAGVESRDGFDRSDPGRSIGR
jgi:hypothetical protein